MKKLCTSFFWYCFLTHGLKPYFDRFSLTMEKMFLLFFLLENAKKYDTCLTLHQINIRLSRKLWNNSYTFNTFLHVQYLFNTSGCLCRLNSSVDIIFLMFCILTICSTKFLKSNNCTLRQRSNIQPIGTARRRPPGGSCTYTGSKQSWMGLGKSDQQNIVN